jgi:hypothetical protein
MKNCIFESFHDVLGVLKAQAQRRLDSQYVSEDSALAEEDASLAGKLHQLVGLVLGGLLGLLVLHQLNADHQALSPHVADYPVLLRELAELSQQVVTDYLCILIQFFLANGV